MQDIIKRYTPKVKMVSKASLFAYRHCPNGLRQAAVYGLYHVRKQKLPPNRFIVFAQGRTGSTLFVDLMNSHPDVFMFTEILAKEVVTGVKNPRKWAEGLATLSRKSTCGFKVKPYQLENAHKQDPAAVLRDFHEHGWKVIYLKRTNLLRHAISDLRSDKTGQFHSVAGKKHKGPIEITWEELVQAIQFREVHLAREDAALAGIPHLALEYEADLLDEDKQRAAMLRVYEFIGVGPHTASTAFRKVTSKEISADVSNYADWEDRLKNSEYAKYLGWG